MQDAGLKKPVLGSVIFYMLARLFCSVPIEPLFVKAQ